VPTMRRLQPLSGAAQDEQGASPERKQIARMSRRTQQPQATERKPMPTSTKKRKSSPPVGHKPKNQKNGGLGGAIARLASNVSPTKKNTRARKPSNTRLDRVAAGAGI